MVKLTRPTSNNVVHNDSLLKDYLDTLKYRIDQYPVEVVFDEISDLRGYAGEVGKFYLIKEHTAGRGADGGGLFQCVQKQVADDDGVWISSDRQGVVFMRVGHTKGVSISHFGGASERQDIDHTPILTKAQTHEGRTIYFDSGSYYFSPKCYIKGTTRLVGSGTASTHFRNKNLGADEGVWYFTDGTPEKWQEFTTVENIDFSADRDSRPSQSAVVLNHLSLSYFINCTFWYTTVYGSDIHFITFQRCRFFDSMITVNEAKVSPSFPINEGLNLIDCYLVRCPIDVTDLADLRYIGTTQYYGEYGIKFTSHRPVSGPDVNGGYPILLSNSVIDNIDGYCLDLNRVAVGMITGCFFSGGRASNTEALRLSDVLGLSFTGNVVHWSGQENMTFANCKSVVLSNNQFSSANGYSIKLGHQCQNFAFSNNMFSTLKVQGGWGIYQGGINFADDSSEAFTFSSNLFLQGKPALVGNVPSSYRAAGNIGLADKL